MKIPTSSSVLLATLALSSSSTCLAAPTGESTQDSIGMTTSSSRTHMSTLRDNSMPREYPGMPVFQRDTSNTEYLQARDGLLSTVNSVIGGIPMVGPPLQKIISPLLGMGAGTQSVDGQTIDQQDLDSLQNAIAEITRALNVTLPGAIPAPVQGAAGTVISKLPLQVASEGKDDSGASDPTDGSTTVSSSYGSVPTAAAAADNGSAPSANNSSGTASPPMPGNPPNSPSLPVDP